MMVEFVGGTGAGKTTVAAAVGRRLGALRAVETAPDLAGRLVGLKPLVKPFYRNLVCDLVGLPFWLGSRGRHGAFLRLALGALARQPWSLQAANRVRSTLRKVGVYELVRRRGSDRIVFVDEGTVLHAHNLFVYTDRDDSAADLERFARVVPLPDVVVHVRAPLAIAVQRSLARPDPPREMRAREHALVERYVGRAAAMFETLVRHPRIADRVITVDNAGAGAGAEEPPIDAVVALLLERTAGSGHERRP